MQATLLGESEYGAKVLCWGELLCMFLSRWSDRNADALGETVLCLMNQFLCRAT